MAPKPECEATEPLRKQPQPFAPPPRPPRRSSSRTQKTRQDSPCARRSNLQEAAWHGRKAVFCTANHSCTVARLNPSTSRFCDLCDVRIPAGSGFECRQCNYDVCQRCASTQQGIEVHSLAGELLLSLKLPKTGQEIIDELVKANVFPKQKYESQWSRFEERSFDPSIYTDIEALIEFSEYAQVKWVKAGYLLQLADSGTRLPRSQDVPAKEVCTKKDLRSWALRDLLLLVISYPWHDEFHPDPTGQSLKQICTFIRNSGYWGEDMLKSCPCFIDFTALAQHPRSAHEEKFKRKFFPRAIKNLNIVYRHEETVVLRLNGPVPVDISVTNSTPYDGRGWCVMEHRISEMKAGWGRSVAYHEFIAGKISEPEVIMSPERFEKELKRLRFTAGEVDRKKVADMYYNTYEAKVNEEQRKTMAQEHWFESMDAIAPKITLVVNESTLEPHMVLNETTKVTAIPEPWSPSELRQKQAENLKPCKDEFVDPGNVRAEGAGGFVGGVAGGAAFGFMAAGPPGALAGAAVATGTKALVGTTTYTWHAAKFQLGLTNVLPRFMGGATSGMVFEWRSAECVALPKARSYKWSGILVGSSYPKTNRSSSVPVRQSSEQTFRASQVDEQMTMILEEAGIIKMTNKFAAFNVVSDYVFSVETYKNLSVQFWTADGVEHDSIHCMNARTHYRRYSAKSKAGAKITRVIATLL